MNFIWIDCFTLLRWIEQLWVRIRKDKKLSSVNSRGCPSEEGVEGRTLSRTLPLPGPCQSAGLSQSGNLSSSVLGSDPFIHVKSYDAGWIQLVCQSMGWFPKPWTEWRDTEGRVLQSLTEAHSLDETALFQTAVSSRVRDNAVGNVSCTVRNEVLGQEKTTIMVIGGNAGVQISLRLLRSVKETPTSVGPL